MFGLPQAPHNGATIGEGSGLAAGIFITAAVERRKVDVPGLPFGRCLGPLAFFDDVFDAGHRWVRHRWSLSR